MEHSDTLLLERWRNSRDAQAFAVLVSRYSGLVYSTSKRILGSGADAEDTAQECFATLAQRNVHVDKYLGPWLHRVATTRSLNRLKSDASRRAREHRYAKQVPLAQESTWNDIQAHIDKAIADLPDRLRRPVVLHFIEGRTQHEVAQLLGLPRTTVTSRIAQGIDRVRKQLHRRGVTLSATTLGTLILKNSAEAAPPPLVASLGRLAIAGSAGDVATADATILGFSLTKAMALAASAIVCFGLAGLGLTLSLADNDDETQVVAAAAEPTDSNLGGSREKTNPDLMETATPPAAIENVEGLQGRLLNEAGEPVADAEAVAVLDEEPAGRTRSDSEGFFVLYDLAPDVYRLYAFKSGVGVAEIDRAANDDHVGDVTLKPMATVHGRVYDRTTNAPIGGMTLILDCRGPTPALRRYFSDPEKNDPRVVTDNAGNYEFQDIPPARYRMDYEPYTSNYAFPGYQEQPISVTLEKGERRDIDLPLEIGSTISGIVTTKEGDPISGAEVWPIAERISYLGTTPLTTDSEGHYALHGLPGMDRYHLLALHPDFAYAKSDQVELANPGDSAQINLVLESGHALHGRLMFDSNLPARDYEITFNGGMGPAVRTGSNGEFTFAHVAGGDHFLRPRNIHDSFPDGDNVPFTMPADKDLHNLILTIPAPLSTPGTVSGRVVDVSGNPMANIRIAAYGRESMPGGVAVHGEAATDANGRYRIENIGGCESLSVHVTSGGYWVAAKNGVAVNSTGVDFVLLPYAKVTGNVVDASTGQPISEFEVRSILFTENSVQGHAGEWRSINTAHGDFQLDDVTPTAAIVEARAPHYAPATTKRFELVPGQSVDGIEIALHPGASLTGRVIDADTQQSLAGVHVRAFAPSEFNPALLNDAEQIQDKAISLLARTDGDGRFAFTTLPPGATISLIAWKRDYETLVHPHVEVAESDDTGLHLVLEKEGRLQIALTDRGHPMEGALFTIFRTDVQSPAENYWYGGTTLTSYTGLSAGTYGIVIWDSNGPGQLGIIHTIVLPGETTVVEADLDEFDTMFGRIEGIVEGSHAGTEVRALAGPALDHVNRAFCDESGHFEITGLVPGHYTVTASDDVSNATSEATVTAGATISVDLRIY